MTTTKANIIDCILNDLEELYWIPLDEKSSLVLWLNSVSKKVCEQLKNTLESTTDEMEQLNADYAKSSELIYEISVPYTCLAPYIRPLIFGFSNRVSGAGGRMFNA